MLCNCAEGLHFSAFHLYSMSDGRLLKPSRPVMSLESSFLQRAFGSPAPNGQLWAAYTEVRADTLQPPLHVPPHATNLLSGGPMYILTCSMT